VGSMGSKGFNGFKGSEGSIVLHHFSLNFSWE